VQIRPKSTLLNNLNSDLGMLNDLNFTYIWIPYDSINVLPNSSQIPIGKEVTLPVALHPWMLTHSRTLEKEQNF
jgi:triacylglycerol lipase